MESDLIIGIDVAGPGRDKTACIASQGGAIVASATFTDSDARPAVLAWLKGLGRDVRLVRVDSAGIGFYFCEAIRDAGYRTVGVNVGAKASDPEKFVNAKAERFWRLRERFQAGEVSGLTDDMLAELAAITWLLDNKGRIAIEGKDEVRAALGHSPDLAEALMLALGEGPPVPYEYRAATIPPYQFGRTRAPAPVAQGGCALHLNRADCGNCGSELEDRLAIVERIGPQLRRGGAW